MPKQLMLDVRTRVRLPRRHLEDCLEPLLVRRAKGRYLDVIFIDTASMRRLNRDYHQVDAATDVLAFPYDGDLLGEVVVCVDVARREARRRRLTLTSELVLYAVHGALHLLGWDDGTPLEAQRMRRFETVLLGRVGLTTDRLREEGT